MGRQMMMSAGTRSETGRLGVFGALPTISYLVRELTRNSIHLFYIFLQPSSLYRRNVQCSIHTFPHSVALRTTSYSALALLPRRGRLPLNLLLTRLPRRLGLQPLRLPALDDTSAPIRGPAIR